MRRALAVALATMAVPSSAMAAQPFNDKDLASSPVLDKSLIAHKHAVRARKQQAKRQASSAAVPAIPAHIAAIAACESGGNPQAVGGGGQYRGMFQMTYSSWAAAGGAGDPAAASVAEQVKRAEILYAQAGPGQWAACGA
jgi:hypothetical protein